MAIGISGGDEEERLGEPFVGPSGRVLRSALDWAGFSGPWCRLNVVNCRTKRQGATKVVNRDPTKAEVAECMRRIVAPLLDGYQGVVLLLGSLAYETVTNGEFGTFAEARGHRLEVTHEAVARLK